LSRSVLNTVATHVISRDGLLTAKVFKQTATMKIWLRQYIFFYLSWLSWTYQIMFLIIPNLPDYVSDYREPTRLCFWLSWIYQIMFLIILNLPDNVSETQLATLQGLTFPFMVFKLTTFSLTKTLHLTLSIRTHR